MSTELREEFSSRTALLSIYDEQGADAVVFSFAK